MAESFLFNIAETVLGEIASLALEETSGCRVRGDLRKLHNTLSNVKAVLLDAEEKQLTSHEIATWLQQLNNVLLNLKTCSMKVCSFFSSSNPIVFHLKMNHKLKEIREAFDEVAANKAKFHLNTHLVPNNTPLRFYEREMSHSFVHDYDIIGRSRERDDIVKYLKDSSQGSNQNLSIVSVVGLGGLGKTALAKMVFNDSRIVEHFEERVWVCLGDLNEFNINQVMVKIVKTITGEKSVESKLEQLQRCILATLQHKKFLLVLDDVWDVDSPKWLELKRMLMSG